MNFSIPVIGIVIGAILSIPMNQPIHSCHPEVGWNFHQSNAAKFPEKTRFFFLIICGECKGETPQNGDFFLVVLVDCFFIAWQFCWWPFWDGVLWPFGKVKWPPSRGRKGHGLNHLEFISLLFTSICFFWPKSGHPVCHHKGNKIHGNPSYPPQSYPP